MLVIDRYKDESIWIGPGIKIMVVAVRKAKDGGKDYVKLGIEADGLRILREELLTGSPQDFQMPDSG